MTVICKDASKVGVRGKYLNQRGKKQREAGDSCAYEVLYNLYSARAGHVACMERQEMHHEGMMEGCKQD
jgi:hypothetical protein